MAPDTGDAGASAQAKHDRLAAKRAAEVMARGERFGRLGRWGAKFYLAGSEEP